MAAGRFLSASVAEDERLNGLSVEAQMLYLMAIPHLDRDGLINGNASVFMGRVCPLRPELTAKAQSLIQEWVDTGLVLKYSTGEGTALWFKGFSKNNPLAHYHREKASRFVAPPGYVRGDKGLIPEDAKPKADPTQTSNDSDGGLPEESGILPEESGNSPREVEVEVRSEVEVQTQEQPAPKARGGVKTGTDTAVGAVFACWGDNMPGTLTPIITDMIDDWITTHGPEEVIRAIVVAVQNNKRHANYVEGVLRNRAAGIDPKQKFQQAAVDAYDSPRKRMKVL